MKIFNLTNSEKSDIKYKISKFPDGQQQITILGIENGKGELLSISTVPYLWKACPITIKSRLNNWLDLELITCAVASLHQLGVKEIHLYTPYFLGSRSDRKFEEGSNNYLKDVICPIINSLNFESVTVLDPHSDVLEACLNNFKKEDNLKLVNFTLSHLKYLPEELENWQKVSDLYIKNDYILISPDAGSSKKIYKLAEQIGYKGDIITCSKERDKDGKLTKTIVPYEYSVHKDKDMIIIDDICDGGATFINIAKSIKENRLFSGIIHPSYYSKIYLIVTHGIFSKGYSELSKYFDGVYTTNSYSNTLKGSFYNYDTTDLVKQLNVF